MVELPILTREIIQEINAEIDREIIADLHGLNTSQKIPPAQATVSQPQIKIKKAKEYRSLNDDWEF